MDMMQILYRSGVSDHKTRYFQYERLLTAITRSRVGELLEAGLVYIQSEIYARAAA